MQRLKLRNLWFGLFLFCLAVPLLHAAEERFPTRPVRLIVPYAPGGATDIIARALGQKLSELWGQQVIVDNRPGGSGILAMDLAVNATQLLQCAATQQLAARPRGPESDLRPEQGVEVERMHALGRRNLVHLVQVLRQQGADLCAGEVIDANLHDRST